MGSNPQFKTTYPSGEKPALQLTVEINAYLREVMTETEHLVFGNPAGFRFDHALPLEDIWIAPEATVRDFGGGMGDVPLAERKELMNANGPTVLPIESALEMQLFKRSIVLAPPGYGKTTLCRRLAYKQALEAKVTGRGFIPIRFPASIINEFNTWSTTHDILSKTPLVQGRLELHRQLSECAVRGELWIFFDGLDEVSEPLVPGLISRLTSEIIASRNRVTITCRVADYGRRSIPGMPVLELSGFSEDRVDFYVENWHLRAGRDRSPDWRQTRLSATRGLLEAHSELRELASSPLLAAVICVVESKLRLGGLANRASLLDRAIVYLLERPEWRAPSDWHPDRPQPPPLETTLLIEIASQLAYDMLTGSSQSSPDEKFVPSGRGIREFVRKVLLEQGAYDPDDAELEPAGDAYAQRLLGHSAAGLLQERTVGLYAFAHRAFQEYLAARYLISHVQYVDRLQLAEDNAWREVFLLTASIAQATRDGLGELLLLVRALLAGAQKPGELITETAATSATLGAEMLAEFGQEAAQRFGFKSAVTDDPAHVHEPSFSGLWPYARSAMKTISQNRRLPESTRMRALCVVSRLGDPRLTDAQGQPLPELGSTVLIPGGSGHVGTDRPLDMHEAKRVPSSPRLPVLVRPFHLAKRPVTNLEYSYFVLAGGYQTPRWWESEEGELWMLGSESFVEELVSLWDQQKELNFVKEFREPDFAVYAKQSSDQIARRTMMRSQPLYWRDSRFNLPTAPVVGVNLWEARAFCAWLTEHWRALGRISADQKVRVPTEIEWEWAASRQWLGSARAYPWGDSFDGSRCLVRDFSTSGPEPAIRHFGAIPVGFFDSHVSDSDLWPQDMAGNVWEWVDSLSLTWDSKMEREVSGGLEKRVVRGGSWFSREPLASHVSFRLDDPPCNAYWDLGFRYAVVDD